ncbi:F-box protein CPR1-like [Prosopis cineraria]|uniref:F-box protein CPR1-like n=1 Tax=Prosopis cineraria TaxID=364024 RepID=UPI00240F623C|nr:F-box protein CPR1-like [Prosopis cineraria]
MLGLSEFVSCVTEMSYYFPQEILEEILHRLPHKSLVNCISVCKSWKSLISDHSFICDHLKRTIQTNPDIASLFLFISLKKRVEGYKYCESQDFYSLYSDNHQSDDPSVLKSSLIPLFTSEHKEVVGTCNGLVCLADYSVLDCSDLIIWNPCIQKYVVLPKPSVTFRSCDPDHKRNRVFFGFGFDSKTKDFKVVRLVATIHNREETPQVEIYSLATGSWRNITGRAPPILLCMQVLWKHQVFINGVIHWVVSQRRNGRIHNFILTFDVVDETFGELMLPQPLRESPYQLSILAGEDSLAVVHTYCSESDEEFVSIWVMKEYGAVDSWAEVFHSNSTCYGGISSVLAIRNSGELVLRIYGGKMILLDPVKELVKDLGPRDLVHAFAGYHVKSLFLINEEQGDLCY